MQAPNILAPASLWRIYLLLKAEMAELPEADADGRRRELEAMARLEKLIASTPARDFDDAAAHANLLAELAGRGGWPTDGGHLRLIAELVAWCGKTLTESRIIGRDFTTGRANEGRTAGAESA